MKYPIGIQNFEEVRRGGYVYVDKTALIYKMISEGKYYFLSRPRRFGKSLLLSTMEAYFQGKKDLFEGLAIADRESEWKEYPILHLDLNSREYKDENSLAEELNRHLDSWEKVYGNEYRDRAAEERFLHVINHAYEQTGKRVVILVDEYDKPLLQAFDNKPLQDAYRSKLKAFYSVLKTMDGKIRFAFLTGVTKFGKVSVFSDLNNLEDLTMLPAYSGICGITELELRHYFDGSVQELAAANGLPIDGCYGKLEEDYDGYHFSLGSERVYNPFSVLNTFKNKVFGDYWFETGTPSFLVEQLKKTDYLLENLTQDDLTADSLNSIDIMDENPLPLLYQSGYLTLRNYDPEFKLYRLGFPNREVREGFVRYLVPYYVPKQKIGGSFFVREFVREVRNGDAEGFMERLEAMFAGESYLIQGDKEIYFHNAMSVIFMMLGFYVDAEYHTANGRMDLLIQTPNYIYIFELKINQSADIALQQIEEKGYAKPFAADSRKLFKIGVNFSTETRTIDDWKIVGRE